MALWYKHEAKRGYFNEVHTSLFNGETRRSGNEKTLCGIKLAGADWELLSERNHAITCLRCLKIKQAI